MIPELTAVVLAGLAVFFAIRRALYRVREIGRLKHPGEANHRSDGRWHVIVDRRTWAGSDPPECVLEVLAAGWRGRHVLDRAEAHALADLLEQVAERAA